MKARDSEVSCLPAGSGRDSHPPGMLHQRHRRISAENGFASSQPRLGRSRWRAGMTHGVFFPGWESQRSSEQVAPTCNVSPPTLHPEICSSQ